MRRALLSLSLGISFIALVHAEEPDELKTVEDRIAEFGDVVRERLEPQFRAACVSYPPPHVTFIVPKNERVIQIYAADAAGDFRYVCTYPVLGASGVAGPKLREGDRQVPEGVYCLRELNPNSLYHLSLWIDYPSSFDRARALEDKRDPGGEIMIHGGAGSRGCVAMGDQAAEDLFVLAALTGVDNVTVVLTPVDFRKDSLDQMPDGAPPWLGGIYDALKAELARYPVIEPTSQATR
ncbi:MAG: L,D-transpeptidase family protein [Verrucomicrobiota bacterium]|nr:L,D-transpeptidase family protein [Verrucomicrobiota bacterium]